MARLNEVSGLQKLDPSPVDESPVDVKKEEYFPTDGEEVQHADPESGTKASSSSSLSLPLGLSGHSPTWYLIKIQKYSSYAFSAYTALHILNTSLIPLVTRSVSQADQFLLLTRPYYQSFPMEHLLITGPLVAHIGSGIALRLYRRRQNIKRYGNVERSGYQAEDAGSNGSNWKQRQQQRRQRRQEKKLVAWPKLSGTSALGYVAMPLVLGHAFINRVLPLWVDPAGGSSNIGLEYVSHGIAKHPVVGNLGFGVLVGVACWHSVWGTARWLGWHPSMKYEHGADGKEKRKRLGRILNGLSAGLAAIWLAGGLGVVGRAGEVSGWLGREYDEIYRHLPIIGGRYT